MALSRANLRVGDSYSEVLIDNLTRGHIVSYAAAVGDFAAEHSDEIYCTQAAGLPSVFAHAMFTTGMTTRMLTNWAGAGRLTKFGVRFATTRAWPGDTILGSAVVEAINVQQNLADLSVRTTNRTGQTLLTAYATIRIDD